jgi:Na+/H+ antiporter NhaD/arsenite permease-like protein
MFIGASASRALIGPAGFTLSGGFVHAAALGSLVAAIVNNLPAAAAAQVEGTLARWAAILALALGPNLLITGSLASLICRRLARSHEASFSAGAFTLMGSLLPPAQMGAALLGLHVTGALP